MMWLDLASWTAAGLSFAGLGLAQWNGSRLPGLSGAGQGEGSVCLCMPARNEAREIRGALSSWIAQTHRDLKILVVDDGSTDGTTEILAELSAAAPERLRVLRNDHLPPGWLGKNHALHLASQEAEALAADWLLFADADVHASPELLSRALAHAQAEGAAFLTLIPGQDAGTAGERLLMPLLSTAFLAMVPVARVADPESMAFCGIGAFSLLRRQAYDAAGGHAAAPLEAIDDMMLGRRVKRAGFACRVGRGGPELHLRMYAGAFDIVRAMRKNAAALPWIWMALPLLLSLGLAVCLAPLWLPFAGHPLLALLLWLLVPALAGDLHQRLTGRPMDLIWAFWPALGLAVLAGGTWAFLDRLRGVNAWRGREVPVR